MSDLTRPAQSDFVRELQRLHEAHLAALRAKDADAIDLAHDELVLFFKYSRSGRLAEWFTRKGEQG